ncbi:MAG TPA: hypothetical protein VK588_16055, partial [Chitinophagaceae bacterium]|nr:hypothetical protein [Chitinophagaceae bacterium]
LMLFLAVFAGFVAENLRENVTERKREKKYIESLVSDLKKDTAEIRKVSKLGFKLAAGQDTLIDLLNDSTDTGNISHKCYHYFFLYTTSYVLVEFNERTISQLLNAGNMRLIEKAGISDSIMDYNFIVKNVQEEAKAYEDYFKKTLDLSGSIFDFTYARVDLHENYTMTPKIQKRKMDFKLLTTDPAIIKRYAIELSLVKGILEAYIISIKEAKDKAVSLIALLKTKYHLQE